MIGSFLKRRWGLQGPTELRNLLGGEGPLRELFDRAEGNAVGLAQGTIDGAGFGHAHLGVVEDQGRNIPGMGVAKAHEATALGRFIDGGFEHPEILFGTAERQDGLRLDTKAVVPQGQAQECRMSDIVFVGGRRCFSNDSLWDMLLGCFAWSR